MNCFFKTSTVVLILFSLLFFGFVADAKVKSNAKIDRSKIYYGDPDHFDNPAVVNASKVFNKIPEYRRIKKEKIKEDDPKYWILLKKANDKFKEAVRKAAQKHGYDLVGEVGSIKIKGKKVPDITNKVIAELPDED